MFLYLLGFLVFLYVLHIILNCNERARMLNKIPGPKMRFIFGNALEGLVSPVELMNQGREYAKTWNNIYRLWIYPLAIVMIYNPEDIETILSSIKYGDKSLIYSFLKPWLGDGLLISRGSKWQERRKILTPTFHFSILKQFFDMIQENCELFVKNLKQTADTPLDILPVISDFTLNSICETAMGTKLSEDATGEVKSYRQAIYDLGHIISHRFPRIIYYSDFIFNLTPLGIAHRKYLKTVHSLTRTVIEHRKDYIKQNTIITDSTVDNDEDTLLYKKKKTAMLDLLLSAEKEGLINHVGIREEVDTFMFEGHDTTASGLTFFFMSIANHRQYQDKIVEELNEIFGDSKRPIKMEDLNKMKYMECCIKESLRMYPPVHLISRNLNETTVLSNYTVPAGTICHISIYDLHHSEKLYKNPETFDPDRFLPENCIGRHPYAYIPFSAGPRNCIGQKFAMMEMKIAIAKVLREFYLLPVTRPEELRFPADVILRHEGPIRVTFVKRA